MEATELTKSLDALDLELDYSSGAANLVRDFYIPCLNHSHVYERAVAYFRSSVYHLIGVAISEFSLRGGKMRLICAPSLTQEDYETINVHTPLSDIISTSLTRDIQDTLLAPHHRPVTELLATLLSSGTLEIKIAYRPSSPGIFHWKLGIFTDTSGNMVSFVGSENETAMAWDSDANYEAFEVFRSWDTEIRERQRIEKHTKYFYRLWTNEVPNLTVTSLPKVPKEILESYANADGIAAAVERARAHLTRISGPSRSSGKSPQDHQIAVIEHWWEEQQGIIDHITGAGKTYTSLCIMKQWLNTPGNAIVVFVPSSTLSDQWTDEIRRELGGLDLQLLSVGGDAPTPNWQKMLGAFTNPRNKAKARIVIATMQSGSRERFLSRVEQGSHLLIVCDEVHRVGSRQHRHILTLAAGGRLGLSATPQRYFDREGTDLIYRYFGHELLPKFTISDAQLAGRLVPYDYFLHPVSLTPQETEHYTDLSKTIAKTRSMLVKSGDASTAARLEQLLHRRARILKNAVNKVNTAIDLIKQEYRSLKHEHWLVYCDTQEQLDNLSLSLAQNDIPSQEYTSEMFGSKPKTLEYFEEYGGILLSIRCLDEGIDIPKISHALILASSTNPREHLQRRGRVLRKIPGKYSACIHDMLVSANEGNTLKVFRTELERAQTFAADARNEFVKYQLKSLMDRSYDDDGIEFEYEPHENTSAT